MDHPFPYYCMKDCPGKWIIPSPITVLKSVQVSGSSLPLLLYESLSVSGSSLSLLLYERLFLWVDHPIPYYCMKVCLSEWTIPSPANVWPSVTLSGSSIPYYCMTVCPIFLLTLPYYDIKVCLSEWIIPSPTSVWKSVSESGSFLPLLLYECLSN